ncbi:Oidioi.mRNA.OKI2018_I69.PAR.g11882.t1.cds [Oikopleura dioica]|uniref:Oidioi.mRNA.OKI2018_I69.PAR.g11882.t1.cds n=1 Tax=Oikopleura dioica TaxID=34765 RepID=A0ABN7S4I3_OIKDI|nr:Oidioi.mRNA.OKI2018_I69.PAR.g11882.t1.cds [Oikopleura dioica]
MEWFESTKHRVRLWVAEKFPTLHEQAQVEVNESNSRKVFFLHQLPPGEEQPSVRIDNTISSNKYTIITFLPHNLFEQFHRVANFYFLFIFIMEVVMDSPVSPYTSGLPLSFVVCITAIKQAYEDYLRYREDKKENNKLIYVVRSGVLVQDRCMNIRPGDIVRVSEGETVPADLVLISSSDPTYHAYYSTAALDGESNLKEASALKKTQFFNTPAEITQIRCYCEVQAPNPELYRFAGRAVFNYGVGGENEEIFP